MLVKDDDRENKVCLTEKHFTLVASLDEEEGRENSASVYFLIAALDLVTD